jgi:hypothetical protein
MIIAETFVGILRLFAAWDGLGSQEIFVWIFRIGSDGLELWYGSWMWHVVFGSLEGDTHRNMVPSLDRKMSLSIYCRPSFFSSFHTFEILFHATSFLKCTVFFNYFIPYFYVFLTRKKISKLQMNWVNFLNWVNKGKRKNYYLIIIFTLKCSLQLLSSIFKRVMLYITNMELTNFHECVFLSHT